MKRIEPLAERVRSTVRSEIILYNLTRVVEELVFNSIDAGATKVLVAVGVATCFVKVSDNGSGIDRDGLLLLGERYEVTSKRHQLADLGCGSGFGFRGEALCSISDVSVLEIVSKVHRMPHGYRKVMKGCKCLYLGISDDRHDAGTTVTVRDLFYNQPVRSKHMQSSPKKVLHLAKECVLRIALVHSWVSFKVIDVESQEELLGTSSSSCSLPLLSTNFGIKAASSLYELNISKGELRLSGYLSGPLGILSLKALQYIYINSRFVCKGPIHKLLNKLSAVYLDDKPHNTQGQIEKPSSRSLTCPAFILNLSCPRSHYDVTFEPLKNSVEFKDWGPVLRFIQDTVSHFWNENVSDDLPEYYEIRRKKSRTVQHAPVQVPILQSEKLVEESISLPPLKASCSSCPMSIEDASNVKKPWDVPLLVEGAYCSLDLKDMSLFASEETTNQMIHSADFASGKQYSNEDNNLLKELSMQDSRCNQVDLFLDSEWQNASFEVKEKSTIPTRTSLCANFHEFADVANADQVFAKPSQWSHSNEMCMQDVGSSFIGQVGMEFCNADFNKQTEWVDIGEEVDVGDQVDMDRMAIPIRSIQFPSFHEYADVANANKVSAETSQTSHFKEKRLQDIGLTFTDQGEMEFSNADFSMQTKWVDIDEEVDARDQVDIDQVIEESEPRHDVAEPLWLLSRCANQYDKILKSKPLSHDMNLNLTAGEWSDEETYLLSHSRKRSKISDCMSLSSTSEWSQRIPNHLSDRIPDTDNFIGGDVHFEVGINTGYDCFQDRNEKYCNSDRDAAMNWLDIECTDFSDGMYYASLQEDISEVGGNKLANSCLLHCSDLFSDEVNQVCMNASYKNKLLKTSNTTSHKSAQFDWNKIGMIKLRNKVSHFQRTEAKRSNSAPPVYKGRKKILDLHLLKTEAQQIDSVDANSPEIGNIKHESRASCEMHFSSKENYANDSLCVPSLTSFRLEKKGFQQKGQCSNRNFPNQLEDTSAKESQNNSNFDLKWQKDCQPSIDGGGIEDFSAKQGAMNSQNAGDHDTILDVLSGTLHLAGDSLVPTSIRKTCLQDAKVLQQVDKKFIPVVAGSILAIIDQHSADERIRLEEFRQKVLSGEMKQITYLEAEKELELPEIGYQLLHSYVEQTQKWGWICDIHGPGSTSFSKKMNVLHKQQTVAKLVAVPCILGVNLTDTDLLEFLQQLADTDGSSTIPPSVLRILNNKACRGAIMFGDTLLPSECSLIVEELKKTTLCFQCAHGRPTTVPLVNLDVLHKQIDKLVLRGMGSRHPWHGLSRQEISVQRAACRLNSAMT